jgi:glycerophosphoryl diester phosphodiesterase
MRWTGASLLAAVALVCTTCGGNILAGRAVLPAATFADGPVSGTFLGPGPVGGQDLPLPSQPVQGFSAIISDCPECFLAISDNGYGAIENSADYHLRVYSLSADLEDGEIDVTGWFELHDPDRRLPFPIVNEFTSERVLTGADLDIESFRRAPDGTFWFGDEFGPLLLHTDEEGRVLEPPIGLPDPDGGTLMSPQSPLVEEGSALRVMNAVRAHALARGAAAPVVSPWHLMLADGDPDTAVPTRVDPPSGLPAASSEIFDVSSLHAAGFEVIPWTVNDAGRMRALIALGVDGIITDRPDVLVRVLEEDGPPDRPFDVQGHRGARGLRPENTLPAMEAALDHLVTTLETDTVLTADGVPVLSHDPHLTPGKCRRADGKPHAGALVKELEVAAIQSTYICDGLLPDRPAQENEPSLSPVSASFAEEKGLPHLYAAPTLEQLLAFAGFYADWYASGPGKEHPEADARAKNAGQVRFDVEVKHNPRKELRDLTADPAGAARAVTSAIAEAGLMDRCTVQSFDLAALLTVHEEQPSVRTVCLFGDFPFLGPSGPGDGTNLQGEQGASPWLAGMAWPYRATFRNAPPRVPRSGGIEGMALSPDGTRLLPMLEKPLAGDGERTLLVLELDIASRTFTGRTWHYVLEEGSTSIGDFHLYAPSRGLVIERDDGQGTDAAFKAVYDVDLSTDPVHKSLLVDLLHIPDPGGISLSDSPWDVGVGPDFAFPFFTIEGVVVLDERHIAVVNDNNFPFSCGRHEGTGAPDDTELIVIRLEDPLGD